jgi:vesicle-associated membrane protein 7
MADDKIIYSLISKNDKPLVEYSNFSGTFNQVCLNYLKRIENDTTKAVKIDDFYIFYINERGVTFLIMTGKLYPKEAAIGCLTSIKREFNQTYEGRDFDGELNFGLNDEYKEKLKMKFDYFNENKDVTDDKIGNLKDQLNLMKEDILNASGLLDDRSDKIKVLDDKADILSRDSNTYYRQSKRVRQAELCKKYKMYGAIAGVCLILIYIIVGYSCGWAFGCLYNK